MTQALFLSVLLALSASPKKSGSGRLASAQVEFSINGGSFTILRAAPVEPKDKEKK